MSHQRSLYPATGLHVRVAIAAPVTEGYVYSVASYLEPLVGVGSRVRVLFGGRPTTGVVVELLDAAPTELDPRRIRHIQDCLDPEPAVLPAVLRLAERVAAAYLVGLGEVLSLCLPPGGDQLGGRRVRLVETTTVPGGCEALARFLRGRGQERWVDMHRIEAAFPTRPIHGELQLLERAGMVEIEREGAGGDPGAVRIHSRLQPGVTRENARDNTIRAPKQRAAVDLLWELGADLRPESELMAMGISRAVLLALERKGIVERIRVAVQFDTPEVEANELAGTFDLTPDQRRAVDLLVQRVGAEPGRTAATPLLLHGVTGSGKTEVYLRAATAALRTGRGVLLLVPEIGLTPQLEQRARAALGGEVVVLHSGMAAGARARAWWKVRQGVARVVVGPRSAVFSPMDDVGLVVIDEEQDSAYKQGERPRYHGREVALWRAGAENAIAVLGSATPAVESFAAATAGSWDLAELPIRVGRRCMPDARLVDMREEWRSCGRTLVSRHLEGAIAERLGRAEQVLVMLNRRGFASAIVCRACGDRGECPNCAVSLTFHRAQRVLRCHYCDHRAAVPTRCSVCGAEALHDLGHGTQRLQEALSRRFPGARIERFDADQTRQRGAHARILSEFGRGEIDLLVGTQMLAKGHDFAAVTLVGVIDADASLSVPDFRASERTFQLLTQVAGRAGRGDIAGEVLLQANQPDHYAISAALAHDYAEFYRHEIEFRRRLGYPPYSHLALCVCRGKVAGDVKEDADRLGAALRQVAGDEAQVIGPATPAIPRLRGRFRMQTLVKMRDRDALPRLVALALTRLERPPADLVIDIVPDSLA